MSSQGKAINMTVFGYTIVKQSSLDKVFHSREVRTRMLSSQIRANRKLAAEMAGDRCLWCGRTREGHIRERATG